MSSHDKDPLEKQDTPSESSESHSDSEIEKTEETLEHLKIQEHRAKEDSDESKPLDSPNQEGTLTNKYDILSETVAGPSDLQQPSLASSDSSSDPKCEHAAEKDKVVEAKDIEENKAKMAGADTDTSDSLPQSSLSSRAVFPLKKKTSTLSSSRLQQGKKLGHDKQNLPLREILKPFFGSSQTSSSSRRCTYAVDSANTSSDVSELHSEVADISVEGSLYYDASESFEKERTPSYRSAVETQSSEASDTNIGEITEECSPPTLPGSSESISTPSGEGGNMDFIAQCLKEAEEREAPSSSSEMGITDPSELANLQQWGLVGEVGSHSRNADDTNDSEDRETAEHEGQVDQPMSPSESKNDNQISEPPEDFDRLFQRNEETREKSDLPRYSEGTDVGCEIQKFEKRMESSNTEFRFPNFRSKQSSGSTDSDASAPLLRPRIKPDTGKKTKVVAKKTKNPLSSSSSSSTEPKSTSSEDLHRKESPEVKSSSESSRIEIDRKSWQKPGLLRSRQISTMSSKDSVITEEEENQTSPTSTEVMEAKDESPEKMETSPEKRDESDKRSGELSESKPPVPVSSDQIPASEAEGVTKDERKVRKSKRAEARLSGSPPSDEIKATSPNSARRRPSKKSRPDKESGSNDSPKQGGSSTSSESEDESFEEKTN